MNQLQFFLNSWRGFMVWCRAGIRRNFLSVYTIFFTSRKRSQTSETRMRDTKCRTNSAFGDGCVQKYQILSEICSKIPESSIERFARLTGVAPCVSPL